jgi:hypothetical protein
MSALLRAARTLVWVAVVGAIFATGLAVCGFGMNGPSSWWQPVIIAATVLVVVSAIETRRPRPAAAARLPQFSRLRLPTRVFVWAAMVGTVLLWAGVQPQGTDPSRTEWAALVRGERPSGDSARTRSFVRLPEKAEVTNPPGWSADASDPNIFRTAAPIDSPSLLQIQWGEMAWPLMMPPEPWMVSDSLPGGRSPVIPELRDVAQDRARGVPLLPAILPTKPGAELGDTANRTKRVSGAKALLPGIPGEDDESSWYYFRGLTLGTDQSPTAPIAHETFPLVVETWPIRPPSGVMGLNAMITLWGVGFDGHRPIYRITRVTGQVRGQLDTLGETGLTQSAELLRAGVRVFRSRAANAPGGVLLCSKPPEQSPLSAWECLTGRRLPDPGTNTWWPTRARFPRSLWLMALTAVAWACVGVRVCFPRIRGRRPC